MGLAMEMAHQHSINSLPLTTMYQTITRALSGRTKHNNNNSNTEVGNPKVILGAGSIDNALNSQDVRYVVVVVRHVLDESKEQSMSMGDLDDFPYNRNDGLIPMYRNCN